MMRSRKRRHGIWRRWLMVALLINAGALSGQSLQFGGYLQLDKRFRVGGDSTTIADFYNRLRLEMQAPMGEKLYTFASLDVRFYDLPRTRSLAGLEDLGQQYPTDLSVWEAYIDVYGFLFDNFDLRIGKQRINWGTADRLNPTDNLNPDDFSDLVNFAEKIPTWAVKGSIYAGDATFTAVWLPSLTPILLPRNSAGLFLGGELAGVQDRLDLPARTPKNSMFALKFSGVLGNWDYSLSYFKGYDDMPVFRRLVMRMDSSGLTPDRLEVGFPRMQVLGLDFATELWDIGFWGEAAVFMPEKVVSVTQIGGTAYPSVELDDAPYLKFTIGGDYTFPGGVYLNMQWMRGFFTERGADQLHDYIFVQLKQSFLNGTLDFAMGGGLEVAEWNAVKQTYGLGFFPELIYRPADNLEMTLGAFVVDGRPGTLFGTWQDTDQLYLRARVAF